MNREEAIKFAKRSADIGVDQSEVADYRDNVIDTLNDEGAGEFAAEALRAFDDEVTRLTK